LVFFTYYYCSYFTGKHKFNRIRQVAPMCPTTLCRKLCKWLNQLICHLGCGLWWAEGSTSSIVFARWRQCALPPGEYDWTVHLLWWCILMSNYSDHLLLLLTTAVQTVAICRQSPYLH